MKSTNRKVLIFALLATTAALGLTLLATSHVTAQGPEIKFKVGDHVEVDTLYSSTKPEESMFWRAGTIIKIVDPENRFGHYVIKLDKDGHEMVFRFIDTQWIRPPQNADNQPADKDKQQKEGNAATPDVAAIACPAADDLKGESQSAIFKRLIAERYLKDGKNLDGVPTTIQFQTFKPGVTHKWRPGVGGESPDGPGGNFGTTVYPVKGVYTICEDYPGFKPTGYKGEIRTRQDENTFYCFKNQFGEWVCNLGEGKTGKNKSVSK
jgi:hypothetical protein